MKLRAILEMVLSLATICTSAYAQAESFDLLHIADGTNSKKHAYLGVDTTVSGEIASIYARDQDGDRVVIPINEIRSEHSVMPRDKHKIVMVSGRPISMWDVVLDIRYLQNALMDSDEDRLSVALEIKYNPHIARYEIMNANTGRVVTDARVKVNRVCFVKVGIDDLQMQ